jgi:hypothetical protein
MLLQSFNDRSNTFFFVITLAVLYPVLSQKVLMSYNLSTSILFLLYDFTMENPASQKLVVAKGISYFMALFA